MTCATPGIPAAFEKASEYIILDDVWYACDTIAERVMGHALLTRDYEFAEKHFKNCEQRVRLNQPLFGSKYEPQLIAVLNNSAIVQIRMTRIDRARTKWRPSPRQRLRRHSLPALARNERVPLHKHA